MAVSKIGSATWWIELSDGSSRRVDSRGLIIGRGLDVDIVAAHSRASRHHALVHVAATGPQIVPMGRAPTWVDGEPITGTTALKAGARVAVPGLELRLRAGEDEGSPEPVAWVLERGSGALLGITASGVSMGGASQDDVVVPGWTPGALRLLVMEGRLSVINQVPIELDGRQIEPESVEPLERGSQLVVLGERLRVLAADTPVSGKTTTESSSSTHPTLPHRVRLQFLPRGGRLEVAVGSRSYRVDLPERRCELVACLLRPSDPHRRAGELVDDERVGARLWPKRAVSRTDLNVLVHRLRKDLTRAGLDGARLIERARGGHATRFCLAPGAEVEVE